MTLRAYLEPAEVLIGIDVGGTKCAGGVVEAQSGRILARLLQATRPERGGAAVLADVVAMAKSLIDEAAQQRVVVGAIGIGVAELVSPEGHVVSGATIGWERVAIGAEVARQTGLPVRLDADVRAAARAEAQFGAGRPFQSFLYVTVGTGVSACLVIDRVPFAGARGLTGTFASAASVVPASDGSLISGQPLEHYAAGPALSARLAATRHGFTGTAVDVLALAAAGDQEAQDIVQSAGVALGAAIGQLVNILDPHAVVIGGGLGLVEGDFRLAIDDAMRSQIWSPLHRDLLLVSAALGNDAGLVGAALAAAGLAS